jgi:hypothetical protein
MNHALIMSLVDIYNKGRESSADMAVRRLAVLVETEMVEMELRGEVITRESFCAHIKEALKQYPEPKHDLVLTFKAR